MVVKESRRRKAMDKIGQSPRLVASISRFATGFVGEELTPRLDEYGMRGHFLPSLVNLSYLGLEYINWRLSN